MLRGFHGTITQMECILSIKEPLFKWKSNNGNLLNPYMCFYLFSRNGNGCSGTYAYIRYFSCFLDKLLSFNFFSLSLLPLILANGMISHFRREKIKTYDFLWKWVDAFRHHQFYAHFPQSRDDWQSFALSLFLKKRNKMRGSSGMEVKIK